MKTATLTIAQDVLDDAPLHIDPHTSRVTLGHLIARRLDAAGHDLNITQVQHDAPATTLTVSGMTQVEADQILGEAIAATGQWHQPGINGHRIDAVLLEEARIAPTVEIPIWSIAEARSLNPYFADRRVQIITPPADPPHEPTLLWRFVGIGTSPDAWQHTSPAVLTARIHAERQEILRFVRPSIK